MADEQKLPQDDKTQIAARPPLIKPPSAPGGLAPAARPIATPVPGPTAVKIPAVSPTSSTVSSMPSPAGSPTVRLTPPTIPLPVQPGSGAQPTPPAPGAPKPTVRLKTAEIPSATAPISPAAAQAPTPPAAPAFKPGPAMSAPAMAAHAPAAEATGPMPMVGMVLSILAVLFLAYARFFA